HAGPGRAAQVLREDGSGRSGRGGPGAATRRPGRCRGGGGRGGDRAYVRRPGAGIGEDPAGPRGRGGARTRGTRGRGGPRTRGGRLVDRPGGGGRCIRLRGG